MTEGISAEPLAICAIFARATTLVDGGWRISFDVPQEEAAKIAAISALNREVVHLMILRGAMPETKEEPIF